MTNQISNQTPVAGNQPAATTSAAHKMLYGSMADQVPQGTPVDLERAAYAAGFSTAAPRADLSNQEVWGDAKLPIAPATVSHSLIA